MDNEFAPNKFFMIQSGAVNPGVKDKFGRAVLYWPGRSIFNTVEEAVEGAKVLSAENPDTPFFVMQVVMKVEKGEVAS